jgi:small-conductance mechanosensitive channel
VPADAESGRGHWIDVLSTILLALAAVATAWATYQAAHWRSEQALAGNRSTAARVQANRAAGVANRQIVVDVTTFTQWVDAYSARSSRLAAFYFRRFRHEFRPAVTAWIATKPLANPRAPLTPFEMPQYTSAALAEADALEAKGAVESRKAQMLVSRADRFTLCVVMFATALFFAGISTRMRSERSRAVILSIGWVAFLGAFVWMATFPHSVHL